MRRPDLFQADSVASPPPQAQQNSERDAVWERKREAFLLNQRAPASPLGSKKVECGPPFSSQFGEDWAKDVQETTKRQQEDYNPKIKVAPKNTNGYCVRKPPGGGSSLDFGWSEQQTGATALPVPPPAHVQNSNIIQPMPAMPFHAPTTSPQQDSAQRVSASPYAWDTPADCARRPRQQQQQQQVAPYADSYPQRDQPITANIGHSSVQPPFVTSMAVTAPYSKENGNNERLPPYAEIYHQREQPITANVGHSSLSGGLMKSNSGADLHGHCFGARPSQGSSNAFAVGSRQNVGNVITDRSSTRVVAPPGGFSSISFC
eukprot:GEMP01061818.1.p1 GENE.GEMP01061818.1~~GEMP01061818.1.p1  ORF type:complete len:318 (+),score=87.25 GEMP01061818.1:56-1009(+)